MKHASKMKAVAAAFAILIAPGCATTAVADKTPVTASQPAAPAADTVHQITFTTHKSSDLAERYSFIREAMEPFDSPDGTPYITPPPEFPAEVKIAEITLPEKNLTFVALLVEGDGWCSEFGNCTLSFHFLRENGEYDQLTAFQNAEGSSYYITNDNSFSVVYCETGTFRRWELRDGALAGPLPMNQSGYFTYEGQYSHPDMKNACPAK